MFRPHLPPGLPFFLTALSALALASSAAAGEAARRHDTFDFGWRFHLGDVAGAEQPAFADSGWRTLDLPHDWSIEGPYDEHAPTGGSGGYLPTGIGWYRKSFTLPESARDRRALIQFDGVYEHSTVWLNGHELGTRPYGYSTFVYDLTPWLNFGGTPNVIAVRVDNSAQPNSRWYSGSGIFRHTWLTLTDPLAIAPSGVWVTTPEISPAQATIRVRTRIRNSGAGARTFDLAARVLDAGGHPVDGAEVAATAISLAQDTEQEIESVLTLRQPHLWSPATPALYRLRSEVRVDGKVVDAVETTFGVRRLVYDVNRGLLLNGAPVKLRGMCLHHDGGAVGAAVPAAVLERRLRLLQEAGVNAIRCSHNPMAPEFYDLCDRLGLLVMDEAFDEWTIRKPQIKFGYSDVFADWFERDLVDFIRRDRNHPSVVMWSAGNEIGEQGAPIGPEVLHKLVEVFHREDPTRPVTAAMDNIFNQHGEAPDAFTSQLDIVGYNYVDRWGTRRETQYADDRFAYPQRKFVGTEDTNPRSTRGEYEFGPLLGGGFADGKIVPGTGPDGALYVAATIRPASLWRFVAMHDYVIGDFGWTGVDYLGEARWPNKLATSGLLDTCGFKKDTFYFYQSIWTSAPMIHLLPHWNWPDRVGQPVPVVAYSNCAAVELFLNGHSLGVKAREFPAQGTSTGWNTYALPAVRSTTGDLQFVWDVLYEPGELKAVGYDRDGRIVATTNVRTAGTVAKLELTADRATLAAGQRDVSSITVRALDANGTLVPLADNEIEFELSGPGKLIGVDNGDPASHESYQSNRRALFHGMALALVQSTATPGAIRLVARARDLPPAELTITAQTPTPPSP
ncbi:MAG TPA: glycoside hydrolase family 2 TIM barrel-domain containing protein [Opitutus sp.]|nr:glycoside hydrolase family 2 TIM barrel-domain containing protein [Opitutus sp.]